MDSFMIYAVCFGVGLLFTLVSAIAGHLFGGGHDAHGADLGTGGHAEAGFDHTGMPGMSAFSPTTIASFITAFGGFGLILSRLQATKSPWISAPLATIGGLMVAGTVVGFFSMVFHKTQSSSESRIGSLTGTIATTVGPIPENGMGEIAYVQSGTRYTAPARAESGVPIAAGQTVKIKRVVGTQFYVEAVVSK
jgi:membrane protein implicated in regulation of membrane protease activity